MFDFRASTLIKLILLFAGVLAAGDYFYRLDKLKTELAEQKSRSADLHETLLARQQEWTELKSAKDKLDQLSKHEQDIIKQRDLLDQKEKKLHVEIKYQADSMAATVEKARSSAIGTLIPELKLLNRPTLYNAKIFKITDDSIAFLHEDGVANLKATAEELPADLQQKYDLGPKAITPQLFKLLK
ncbi:hypothetical protein [Prosthecobacter sp.]|uniref:hypothetical protein n=1 Tax=Prosthecobacter sp. TaxID=1965333 RepID=UPI00378386F9